MVKIEFRQKYCIVFMYLLKNYHSNAITIIDDSILYKICLLFISIVCIYHKICFAVNALGGRLVTVDELMKTSDFVVVAAALNDDTKLIVSRERIATMKPNAILVNIGRGS